MGPEQQREKGTGPGRQPAKREGRECCARGPGCWEALAAPWALREERRGGLAGLRGKKPGAPPLFFLFIFFNSFPEHFSKDFLNRILRAKIFQQESAAQLNTDAPA